MIKEIDLRLLPRQAANEQLIVEAASRFLSEPEADIRGVRIIKRSIDARKQQVIVNLRVCLFIREDIFETAFPRIEYREVGSSNPVIVVGAGPAGLFAALRLIQSGIKPIVVERGKNVSDRKRDIALISREHRVDPESNYSFGEGGAGAFSDGKLFTRSKKRGSTDRILQILCQHGASSSILVDVHPHIGTDKLPRVIAQMRETILRCGGEVHFETRMDRLIVQKGRVEGIECNNGQSFRGEVILATGHSARDVYRHLYTSEILLEPKGIAIGVRLEHPQELIDQIQYHSPQGRGEYLPPAEYSFVTQSEQRGVYSFCMCPGGFVVPAASGPNQVVVNGMSPSTRGGRWANSGIVVELRPEDVAARQPSVLDVMHFQEQVEAAAFLQGGQNQTAPAQRMADFVQGKFSGSLLPSSYTPGIVSSPLHQWLPPFIGQRLQDGLRQMGQKSRGFLTNEAQLIGVESRTSAPVRIPRDKETLEHPQLQALYPCGEGAGFAGGIVSAAIDGERCAEAIIMKRSMKI